VKKTKRKASPERKPSVKQSMEDKGDIPEEPDEFNKMHLEAHNKYRKLHGVPPVVWSGKLQRDAYKWAAVNLKDKKMYHSTNQSRGNQGENLAGGHTTDPEMYKPIIETT